MPAKRDWVLVAATVVAVSCGTNYSFSAYAPQLANRLGLSSTQTNAVGAAGNMGVYLSSPIIGRVVDRRGPVPNLIFAALALTSGYLLVRAFYASAGLQGGLFHRFGTTGLACAELLTGIGSTAGLSSAGNSVAKSYKKRRAAALSVVLSAFGLSAFFYSTIASLFLHSRSSDPAHDTTSEFLLLLALGCLFSMLVGIAFVRPVLHPSLASPSPSMPDSAEEVDGSAAVPVSPAEEVAEEAEQQSSRNERTPLLRSQSTKSVEVRNVAGLDLLKELDFYLIFLFNGLCAGVGLCYINNLGTVVRSLALRPSSPTSPSIDPSHIPLLQSRLVSLLSLFNFFGRLLSGFGSDYLLHNSNPSRRMPRVWWLVFTASVYCASQVVASQVGAVGGWKGLVWPTMMTGLAHGSLFGISGIIGLERFGMANFSSTNGVLALAPALFGQTTNLLFGRIYDSHTRSSPSSLPSFLSDPLHALAGTSATCTAGRECYAGAFHLTTGMSAAAIAVGLVLSCLTGITRPNTHRQPPPLYSPSSGESFAVFNEQYELWLSQAYSPEVSPFTSKPSYLFADYLSDNSIQQRLETEKAATTIAETDRFEPEAIVNDQTLKMREHLLRFEPQAIWAIPDFQATTGWHTCNNFALNVYGNPALRHQANLLYATRKIVLRALERREDRDVGASIILLDQADGSDDVFLLMLFEQLSWMLDIPEARLRLLLLQAWEGVPSWQSEEGAALRPALKVLHISGRPPSSRRRLPRSAHEAILPRRTTAAPSSTKPPTQRADEAQAAKNRKRKERRRAATKKAKECEEAEARTEAGSIDEVDEAAENLAAM
ncbi:hypothetical protein JCM11251_008015 [Rhodosporidiobolus azoricus]